MDKYLWIACGVLILLVMILIAVIKVKCNKIKDLKEELKEAQTESNALLKYINDLKKIDVKHDEIETKIREAKDDEEVLDIINGIINNNNKLCNDKKKTTSTKTGKKGTATSKKS